MSNVKELFNMRAIFDNGFFNSHSGLGARLPDVLRQHFALLSVNEDLQDFDVVFNLAACLILNIPPDAEIK